MPPGYYQADINIVRIMVYISFPIGKWRKRPAAGPALFVLLRWMAMRGNHEERGRLLPRRSLKIIGGGVNNYILYTKGPKEMPILLTSE